jgi:hypothetical protein
MGEPWRISLGLEPGTSRSISRRDLQLRRHRRGRGCARIVAASGLPDHRSESLREAADDSYFDSSFTTKYVICLPGSTLNQCGSLGGM